MSRKPNPNGVSQLSESFREISEVQDAIRKLENVISRAQEEIEPLRERLKEARGNIQRLMQEMDIHAPGNTGYEGRLMWVLQELNAQAERYGRLNP